MKIPMLALVIAGTVVAGCGTVRENRFNETPLDQDVEYHYRNTGTDVVYVRPSYRVVPIQPVRVVPVTRYYYVD